MWHRVVVNTSWRIRSRLKSDIIFGDPKMENKLLKVVVFGATGGTGLELCRQAAEAGHNVTAYVRSPEKLKVKHPNLVCVKGTLEDAAAVEAAVRDKDAVLVALGGHSLLTRDTTCSVGTRVILGAMKNTGVRRIVVCSSYGVGPENRINFYRG